MKKKIYMFVLLFVLATTSHNVLGQAGVGIGVVTPDQTAVLHIQPPSNNKGLLIPRLTTDQRNTISSPAEGLLVYDTVANSLYHYNGGWQIVGVPPGGIMMWSGAINNIPVGWALCDGTNGRPDLRERFIVGAGGDNGDVPGSGYAPHLTGGFNEVTLTLAQMPSHSHTMQSAGEHQHFVKEVRRGDEGSSGADQSVGSHDEGGDQKNTSFAGDHVHTINPSGSNAPHENRPPYYALAFIIKL